MATHSSPQSPRPETTQDVDPSINLDLTAKASRQQEKSRLPRFMMMGFVGSGLLHGLTIGLGYFRPAQVNAVKPAEPEMEIVIEEEMFDSEVPKDIKVDEVSTVSGNTGGDEALQVATLTPQQETIADPLNEQKPPEPEPEVTDADLRETPQPQPTPKPKKTPQPQAPTPTESKDAPIAKSPITQKGEKNGNPNGSEQRGLSQKTGQGTGTGNIKNGNGGNGTQGRDDINAGGTSQRAKPVPTPSPTIKPTSLPSTKPSLAPQPVESPKVAIVPSPKPPEPAKEPNKPRSNYGYERKDGERIATGTKAKFTIEYDQDGKVKGGKLTSSTGDAELDAAQLRDFNRALENNKKLRQQLEDLPAEKRDRPIRFVFDGEGENAAEQEQIQRNRDLTAQQEAQRAAERAAEVAQPAQATQPVEPSGGLALPVPAPAIDLPSEQPAKSPITPVKPEPAPVEAPPPSEPAPVEAVPPPEPAPIEAAPPSEPAPVEAAPPPEPAPIEAAPPSEPAPVEAVPPPEPAPVEAPGTP